MSTGWRTGPFVAVRYIRVPPGVWAALATTSLSHAQGFETAQELQGYIRTNTKPRLEDFGRYCLVREVDVPKLQPEALHELLATLALEFGDKIQDPDERFSFYERTAITFMEKAHHDRTKS